jgi:hypothetical protein
MTEAHAKLSVVRNCSKSSLRVYLGEGKQLAGGGWSAVAGGGGGGGRADSTQGERIWSSFQRQKVERGLLLLTHQAPKNFFKNFFVKIGYATHISP